MEKDSMSYSAHYSAPGTYTIPANFYPGTANAMEIPVIGGEASCLNNFVVNADGRLQFTGTETAAVVVKAKFSFGSQKPSQVEPNAPLDYGPKAILYGWVQVGKKKSVPARLDQTLYYPDYEYPFIYYNLDVDQLFELAPGDVLQFFACYEWVVAPRPPVELPSFYLTVQQASLSWLINTDSVPAERPTQTLHLENKTAIPLGRTLNNSVCEFQANTSGRTLIQVRMNVRTATLFNDDTKLTTTVISSTWFAFLAVNGELTGTDLVAQAITNQPNIFIGDNTVWPSSVELCFLADLAPTDKISVIVNVTSGLATSAAPPFFLPVPDGHGSLAVDLDFDIVLTPPLSPSAMLSPVSNSSVLVPLGGNLATATTFPLDATTALSGEFQLVNGKLRYTGGRENTFKIRGALNIGNCLLENSDLDPAVASLQKFGMAIGVNGRAVNGVETPNIVYTDNRFGLKWIASQFATNVVKLTPGDEVSLLVYTNNNRYMNVPPEAGRDILIKLPTPGSVLLLTAAASLLIEKMSNAESLQASDGSTPQG
jgi:hypothetical protein